MSTIDTAHALLGSQPSLVTLLSNDSLQNAFAMLTVAHYNLNTASTSVYSSAVRTRQARESAAVALENMRRVLGLSVDSGRFDGASSSLDSTSLYNSSSVATLERQLYSRFQRDRGEEYAYRRKRALQSQWHRVALL